ncbi:MAG: HigA family addiction module antitoxin [bacterium]
MTSRSRTTTRGSRGSKLSPVHPGEVLLEEFLTPFGVSQYRISKDIQVPPRRINEIVHGHRSITADTALRLARYFGNSAAFWMNLQARYDLEVHKDKLGRRIDREIPKLVVSAMEAGIAAREAGRLVPHDRVAQRFRRKRSR